MIMVQSIGTVSDRLMSALVSGLEFEFGRSAREGRVQQLLNAEEADLRWDAKAEERWIGEYESTEDEQSELVRIAIFGRLDGKWFCAAMLVDGVDQAHGMMRCRQFRSLIRARDAMLHA